MTFNINKIEQLSDDELREEYGNAYHEVFDEKGDIKLCGREKCKKLIILTEEMNNRFHHTSDTVFGNKETGVMLTERVKKAAHLAMNF